MAKFLLRTLARVFSPDWPRPSAAGAPDQTDVQSAEAAPGRSKGSLAPEHFGDLSRFGPRAMLGSLLTTCLVACVAGAVL
jgi:hypothetical protein